MLILSWLYMHVIDNKLIVLPEILNHFKWLWRNRLILGLIKYLVILIPTIAIWIVKFTIRFTPFI